MIVQYNNWKWFILCPSLMYYIDKYTEIHGDVFILGNLPNKVLKKDFMLTYIVGCY